MNTLLLVENGDGNIVQKNLLAMGDKAIQCEPVRNLLTGSFVVIIADKKTRTTPPLSMIQCTKNFVYVENPLAGARLMASIENSHCFNDNLVILGNDAMLSELSDQSLPYRISLLTVDGNEPREFDGFKVADCEEDGIYKLYSYEADIQSLSEDRLNSVIENMDTWMNDQDTFGHKVDEVVDAMKSIKERQDDKFAESMLQFDEEGNPVPLSDEDIAEEFSNVWDEMIDIAGQLSKVVDVSLQSQKVVKDTLETANSLAKTSEDRFTANEHYILETQDKLSKTRNQVALVVEKVDRLEKKGRDIVPWIISILALVGMVINWLI